MFTFAPLDNQQSNPKAARNTVQPVKRNPIVQPKLEDGFDKRLLELEFTVEKAPTPEAVMQLVA